MNAPFSRLSRRKVGGEGAGVHDCFAFAAGGAKLPGAEKPESFGLEVRVALGQGGGFVDAAVSPDDDAQRLRATRRVREARRGRCVGITIFSSSRSLYFIGPLREGRTDAQGGLMALARAKCKMMCSSETK